MQQWFYSDPHFGHEKLITEFKLADGRPARHFSNVDEMDETIIMNHNAVAKPIDHCYCLGDVAIAKKHLKKVQWLSGHQRLIFGNHDIFEPKDYMSVGYKKLHAARVFDNILFTHIPVHVNCLGRFRANVHGHMHSSKVLTERVSMVFWSDEESPSLDSKFEEDPRYLNICAEYTDYKPVSLGWIVATLKERGVY